jgi:TP901 family phage tail tape measure protein
MSAGPIDTAFIEIRPDFRNFGSDVRRGVQRNLGGPGVFGPDPDLKRRRKDTDDLDNSSRRLGQTLRSNAGLASLLGSNLGRAALVGGTGLAGVGIAAALAVDDVAVAAIDFESAFAGVEKTVDASEATLAGIREDFIDLSTEIPVTTTELAALGEAAGQLGIETSGITEFTKTVAELGVTTNLASEDAANALARLANITQLPQTQFDNLGSTIVALGNKTASTEQEIVEFGLRIAGAGSQIGLTQDEILAFGASLASLGLNAEAGGTAISTLFSRLASDVASGGQALDQFAAVAGQSSEEFAQSFREEPAEAVVAFVQGLARVRQEGGNVFATLDELGLGGIRVRDSLLRAAGSGDLLTQALQTGADAWRDNNALTTEAQKRFETTASGIQLMKNEANALAIELGDALLPSIDSTARGLGGLIGAIRDGVGALGELGGGEFDAVNADLTGLVDQLQQTEDQLSSFREGEGENSVAAAIGADIPDLVERIKEIGQALNDTPAGVQKFVRIFSAASPQIAAAVQDGIITPLERAELETTKLGAAFVSALPPDMFSGIGAGIRSGIEDSSRQAVQGVATLGADIRSAIEDESRQAVVTAEAAGAKIGQSLAAALARSATEAANQAISGAGIADETFDRAVISGDESAQLAALKKKRAGFMAAIAEVDEIENPSDARIQQRRDLVSQAASVTQQIAAIEQGIIADQETAAAEAEQRGREAAAASERADRAFVDGLTANRADEENAIVAASADDNLQNDLRAHIALRNTLTVQINQKAQQIKDLEIRRDTLRDLRERRARVIADIAADRAAIREDAAEAAQERTDARADALSDAVTIAELKGDEAGQEKALLAEIAFWERQARLAKKGSEAQRDAIIQALQSRKRLKALRKDLDEEDSRSGGTSVLDLLTENTRLFGSIGGSGGQAGDPLSGFDFSSGITQWLRRMDTPAQQSGRSISVRGRLDSPQAGTTGDPAIDRLVQALDRNTEAVSGNSGTSKGKNVVPSSPILRNDRRFWASDQARERMEAAN